MATVDALKGYILEEVLAYLIKGTGYSLLVDESQDPNELKNQPNGLVVMGRGAKHQVDVLGQLSWIPAFTFPLRLFVEAKFRKNKTSISPVRSAVGIIEDINQNYFPSGTGILLKRYSYNYALFSVSGFSSDAINMAMAHRISLIDLSGPEYSNLLNSIDRAAQHICKFNNRIRSGVSSGIVKEVRKIIRIKLGTWPIEVPIHDNNYGFIDYALPELEEMLEQVKEFGELFVGMANGPFLLILKADDPNNFLNYSKENPTHEVSISWSYQWNDERQWVVRPVNGQDYELSFTLPETIGDWIFNSESPTRTALDAKRRYLSEITIYHSSGNRDELFKLLYSPTEARERQE